MRRFERLNYLLLIAVFCATFAHARSHTLAQYFEQMGSQTHQLRAVDTTPPAIPAIKEIEETEKSRVILEEYFLSLILCTVFLPKTLFAVITHQVQNAHTTLSKYKKSVVSVQTVK